MAEAVWIPAFAGMTGLESGNDRGEIGIGGAKIVRFSVMSIRREGGNDMEVKEISLDLIGVSEFNARKDLNAGTEDAGVRDLANSIGENGLFSPVIARSAAGGRYELIAGQRRLLACRRLGMDAIPAIVRDDLDDVDATVVSLVENVQRADMNPMDKARAFRTIRSKYGSDKLVSRETGVSVPTIRRYSKLLKLASSIQDRLTTSIGSAGVETLAMLADYFDAEDQEYVLNAIGGFNQRVQREIIKRSDGGRKQDTVAGGAGAGRGVQSPHVRRRVVLSDDG